MHQKPNLPWAIFCATAKMSSLSLKRLVRLRHDPVLQSGCTLMQRSDAPPSDNKRPVNVAAHPFFSIIKWHAQLFSPEPGGGLTSSASSLPLRLECSGACRPSRAATPWSVPATLFSSRAASAGSPPFRPLYKSVLPCGERQSRREWQRFLCLTNTSLHARPSQSARLLPAERQENKIKSADSAGLRSPRLSDSCR